MKKALSFLAVFGFVVAFAQVASNLTEFKENIATQKAEAKSALKPFRFDGSKVTYFNYKTYRQTKEVEIYLFNNTDYRFSFNGKSLPNDITVQIYDKDKGNGDRILLKEFNGIKGKNMVIESGELNDIYEKKGGKASRLKRVFVNYVIPSTPGASNKKPTMKDRGAAVLVMGYKY